MNAHDEEAPCTPTKMTDDELAGRADDDSDDELLSAKPKRKWNSERQDAMDVDEAMDDWRESVNGAGRY